MAQRIAVFSSLAAAVVGLACSGGGSSSGGAASGMQAASAQTVTHAASTQISFSTTDTAQPVEPATLLISDADTNDTAAPESVN
jgi:hypothetical protein